MELIQEVNEDKKLTVFLEKRFKEYERDISCSEITQHNKDENEVYLLLFKLFYFSFYYSIYPNLCVVDKNFN